MLIRDILFKKNNIKLPSNSHGFRKIKNRLATILVKSELFMFDRPKRSTDLKINVVHYKITHTILNQRDSLIESSIFQRSKFSSLVRRNGNARKGAYDANNNEDNSMKSQ